MKYLALFSPDVTVGMIFFTIYPFASAYYTALRLTNLPTRQTAIFGLFSTTAALTGIYLGCSIIGQAQQMQILDLFTIFIALLVHRFIISKGPGLFLKYFFKFNPNEVAN